MLSKLFKNMFGDSTSREIQRLRPTVERISALEPEMQARSDEELRALTDTFRARLENEMADLRTRLAELRVELDAEADEDERRSLRRDMDELLADMDSRERAVLDDILPEAFAAVRETSVRRNGQRHFDEQIWAASCCTRTRSPK